VSAPPSIALLGTGSSLPTRIVTNDELSRQVETSDEWIFTRTGIRERRIMSTGESTTVLATAAARSALLDANVPPAAIDLLIVATCTPDTPMPSTACMVQTALNLSERTACFDVNAACTGFLYALDTAWALLASGRYHYALVVGAEKMSSLIDWQDRTTCVLFGDGAGAVVIGPTANGSTSRILATRLGAIPGTSDLLHVPSRGANLAQRLGPACIIMKGREVFKFAVRNMEEVARELLEKEGYTSADLACIVPHQANLRIIHALAQYLKFPAEKILVNLERYGNTSAASIPLALDEARRSGRIQRGDLILLVAFGAGLTYGGALIRW
jgi:3-oxoacyl-[acyl-carrier-protein] synthase III